jgi:hypothetical protein
MIYENIIGYKSAPNLYLPTMDATVFLLYTWMTKKCAAIADYLK